MVSDDSQVPDSRCRLAYPLEGTDNANPELFISVWKYGVNSKCKFGDPR